MTIEQQENDDEINDEYRPTTNGSDTTTLNSETNADNDECVANGTNNLGTNGLATSASGNGNGATATAAAAAAATTSSTAPAPPPPNWNQSQCNYQVFVHL